MCSGNTTTTSVKTGELSALGETYNALFTDMMLQTLQDGGYDLNPEQVTKWSDEGKANQYQAEIDDYNAQILEAEQKKADVISGKGKGTLNLIDADIARLRSKLRTAESNFNKLDKVTYTDYNITKKQDPRILDAIDKYGENSSQVQALQEQIKSEEVFKVQSLEDINHNYLVNLNKLSSGDLSYTQEQADQVNQYIAPIKNIITETTNNLLSEYGNNEKLLGEKLNELTTEINNTGFAVSDALEAASLQFEKSGTTLMDTLKKVNESDLERTRFEFDLLSEKADLHAAQQAAALGLPPGSMSEKLAAQKIKADALKSIELDLNSREAQGALQIQSGVEAGKQQISLSRVALAESQGGKLEDVAGQSLGLTADYAGKRENAIGTQGNALIGLEQQNQAMLQNVALGGLPSLLQGTSAGLGFSNAQDAAKTQQAFQLMSPIIQQLGVEQQRQFAESTTTQKQKTGFLDTFTDILGAGASIAGAAYGMSGGFGGGGGGIGGGGGGFSPVAQPVLSTYNQNSGFNLGNYYSQLG